jgi:hypothetical protein
MSRQASAKRGRQGAPPWGGIVPPGLQGQQSAEGALAAPVGGSGAPPPVPEPPSVEDRVLRRLQSIDDRLGLLCDQDDRPPELLQFTFDGAAATRKLKIRDDHMVEAASYAIYNPSAVPIYVAFAGGEPTAAGGAFPVPAPGWVVMPLLVGSVMLGADATALAEAKATIWRIAFPHYQPFSMGKL